MASTNTSPFGWNYCTCYFWRALNNHQQEVQDDSEEASMHALDELCLFPTYLSPNAQIQKFSLMNANLKKKKVYLKKKGQLLCINYRRRQPITATPWPCNSNKNWLHIYILHKTLQNVHRMIISNRENLEINVMLNKKIHKQTIDIYYIRPHNNKPERNYEVTWQEELKTLCEESKLNSGKYILYKSTYMKFKVVKHSNNRAASLRARAAFCRYWWEMGLKSRHKEKSLMTFSVFMFQTRSTKIILKRFQKASN